MPKKPKRPKKLQEQRQRIQKQADEIQDQVRQISELICNSTCNSTCLDESTSTSTSTSPHLSTLVSTQEHYQNLKKSKLWMHSKLRVPGFATYPQYEDIHIQVQFGGLKNYHNDLYWYWLMAYAGITSIEMGDKEEGKRIWNILKLMAKRDGTVGEIYKPETGFPLFETATYMSEKPFTLAACYGAKLKKYLS